MPQEKEIRKESKQTISRREFLKDAGLIVGGAAVGSMALVNACGSSTTVTAPGTTVTKTNNVTSTVTTTVAGPGGSVVTVTAPVVTKVVETAASASTVSLTVNGKKLMVPVNSNMTLQEMLREKLSILSPKDMCFGYGACGSCGVIMNGRPVLSCMALAIECAGAVIETAEGIAAANHPLVDAYVMNICMQCGYCTPGLLTTTKALLDSNPNPTEKDIRDAIAGNICRCGTYPAHVRAVLEAAAKINKGVK
jgi:aerobic-type carbon monoxide dehydrogenase small subunit (CoxS/CutS family)